MGAPCSLENGSCECVLASYLSEVVYNHLPPNLACVSHVVNLDLRRTSRSGMRSGGGTRGVVLKRVLDCSSGCRTSLLVARAWLVGHVGISGRKKVVGAAVTSDRR